MRPSSPLHTRGPSKEDAMHLYLTLHREALIASMLPPETFAVCFATGRHDRTRRPVVFVELDRAYAQEIFADPEAVRAMEARCVPHEDGAPKKSLWVRHYRVLESVPLAALGALYLATADGRTLRLEKSAAVPAPSTRFHLFFELAPTRATVVSIHDPAAFCRVMTCAKNPYGAAGPMLWVPKVAFADLELGGWANGPVGEPPGELPYETGHLADCLEQLTPEHPTKILSFEPQTVTMLRTIRSGLYVGAGDELVHYAFPSREALATRHYDWWKSARLG